MPPGLIATQQALLGVGDLRQGRMLDAGESRAT